jgi:hypothetical protein
LPSASTLAGCRSTSSSRTPECPRARSAPPTASRSTSFWLRQDLGAEPRRQIAGIPISTNFLNTHRHEPSSHEAHDPAACARLYDAAAGLLEEATGASLLHRLKAGVASAALAE